MEIWSRRSSGTGQLLCCLEWFVHKRAHRSGDAAQSAVAGHVMKGRCRGDDRTTVHSTGKDAPWKPGISSQNSREWTQIKVLCHTHTHHTVYLDSPTACLLWPPQIVETEVELKLNIWILFHFTHSYCLRCIFVPCNYRYSANLNSHLFPIVYVCKASAISFL